ncbi:MAG: anti-sigma regulatory factor [Roseiflexus sp.]|nr:anti-sigma regulatory factor [Roseiflexus sp.]MCS7290890.1 anti-sigma regulatory factor [Roseiflexus sp.]MDW8146283.1 anti-sigma regulatory factor [Roseiflexaceae bacterium]MDW8232730.1 anti-sigma regulatory factor [Roseiflexaceae bacterium]
MMHSTLSEARNVHVGSGYDVVLVRQHVRQMARQAGFCLTAQARMTAIVSEVARAALERHWNADFLFRLIPHHHGRYEIEVICHADNLQRDAEYLSQLRRGLQEIAGSAALAMQQQTGQFILRFYM